jgi:hypothetical protein
MPVFLLSLVTVAMNQQAIESRESIVAKIESSNQETLNRWVQLSCVGSYKAAVTTTKLNVNEDHLAAFISSIGCDQFAIVVFSKVNQQQNAYVFENSIKLFSAFGVAPKVEYIEMATRGSQEIFVTGLVSDSGSGVLQRDCLVLKLLNKKLATVFVSPQFVRFSKGNANLIQNSKFVIEDSKSFGIAGNNFLREERTVSVGGRAIMRTRNCFWNADIQHFACVEGFSGHTPASH